jgi:hypothetical protein
VLEYDPLPDMPIAPTEDTRGAHQALLDAIVKMAPQVAEARDLRDLAEAYAWLMYPNQSHGGAEGIKPR